MGIPSFFRWIQEKFPKVIIKASEDYNELDSERYYQEHGTEANTTSTTGGSATTVATASGNKSSTMMPFNSSSSSSALAKFDLRLPHPNIHSFGYEFDNLYLDMNGIIHPCCHPEGEEPPANEMEMFKNIFKYLDRIFSLIRPRKLIFMAIDGVAPRAKMNQQRSRRFRAAQEADEAKKDEENIRSEAIAMGIKPPPKKKAAWDSNVITPGTEFLCELSKYLRHYVADRQNYDPAWRSVKVIISDSQSPGEGEHKIMQFVRRQRAEPDHDPNTRHVLYGLDADLIMLALASHEVHFTVLREEVLFGREKNQKGKVKGLFGPSTDLSRASNDSIADDLDDDFIDLAVEGSPRKPFVFLKVWVLREYLAAEFHPSNFMGDFSFGYDFERVIDDIVMLCFLIGNDFLPHLPVLSIREGALELLFDVYKRYLPMVGGYLTNDGEINLSRFEVVMGVIGTIEDDIFRKRKELEDREKTRKDRYVTNVNNKPQTHWLTNAVIQEPPKPVVKRVGRVETPIFDAAALIPLGKGKVTDSVISSTPVATKRAESVSNDSSSVQSSLKRENESSSDQQLSSNKKQKIAQETSAKPSTITKKSAPPPPPLPQPVSGPAIIQEDASPANIEKFEARLKEMEKMRNIQNNIQDTVRLGEKGWKDRYYVTKFGEVLGRDPSFRRRIVENYVQGLCWVMQYYYKGCQSWKWFYEFHYAPFASDFIHIENINIKWAPSKPFKPFEQLMGVFPPQSSHALPKRCAWYMTSSESPIIEFYPKDFKYDDDGKPMKWLWIALLPFIDEVKLLDVCKKLEDEYNEEEKKRNSFLPDIILIHESCKGAEEILKMMETFNANADDMPLGEVEIEDELVEVDATPKTAGDLLILENEKSDLIQGTKSVARMKNLGAYLSAREAYGISGFFLPLHDERLKCEIGKEVTSPNIKALRTITGEKNKVFSCEFRLPPMKPHLSQLIPGVTIPKPELSEEDLQPRRMKSTGIDVTLILDTKDERKAGWQRSWGAAEPRFVKSTSIQQSQPRQIDNQSSIRPRTPPPPVAAPTSTIRQSPIRAPANSVADVSQSTPVQEVVLSTIIVPTEQQYYQVSDHDKEKLISQVNEELIQLSYFIQSSLF